MANTKISNLTALGSAPAADDLLALVDVSAGATKKLTVSDLNSGLTLKGMGQILTLFGNVVIESNQSVMIPATVVNLSTLITNSNGVLLVIDRSAALASFLVIMGALNSVVLAALSASGITATKDNPSSINVYYDSGYKIQNTHATSRLISLIFFG